MTGVEGYQAADETSGTTTCACDEVAGDVVLEVAVTKGLSIVCSLDDPSTGVSHNRRDILSQGSGRTTCTEVYEVDGGLSTTDELPCSGASIQSGVGVNSSCGGASIGDVCVVFCAEGYQAVSGETSTLTGTCD